MTTQFSEIKVSTDKNPKAEITETIAKGGIKDFLENSKPPVSEPKGPVSEGIVAPPVRSRPDLPLFPFLAGPQGQVGQQQGQAGQQLVPLGLIGSLISALAPVIGGAVGGTAGQVISGAGQFGSLLPFQAGPQV